MPQAVPPPVDRGAPGPGARTARALRAAGLARAGAVVDGLHLMSAVVATALVRDARRLVGAAAARRGPRA